MTIVECTGLAVAGKLYSTENKNGDGIKERNVSA